MFHESSETTFQKIHLTENFIIWVNVSSKINQCCMEIVLFDREILTKYIPN